MEKAYKLIALDMDGTLLRSDKTIDPDSVRDIRAACGAGIQVAFCTGRGIPELTAYFDIVPMMRYAVCDSGAVVYDCAERRILSCESMDRAAVCEAVRAAAKYRAMVHFLTAEESVATAEDVAHMADFHMGVYQKMFSGIARQVDDMMAEARRNGTVAKVNLYFRSAEDRETCCAELRESGLPFYLAYTDETSLELTSPDVTKASGLKRLADHLGIPMAQTVGIGDSGNDRAMLEQAGLSVAMGNADADLRELCDRVTLDNDHNGVGAAIRALLSAAE